MNIKFNDLSWHDAYLKDININRELPGEKDVIQLSIKFLNDNYFSTIEFIDCYAFTANMHFGVVACESILTAECLCESKELNDIRQQWLKVGVDLHNLKHFKITTNSTNSVINIFSLDCKTKININ